MHVSIFVENSEDFEIYEQLAFKNLSNVEVVLCFFSVFCKGIFVYVFVNFLLLNQLVDAVLSYYTKILENMSSLAEISDYYLKAFSLSKAAHAVNLKLKVNSKRSNNPRK